MQTIEEVVTRAHAEDVPPDVLVQRLVQREDEMADLLRQAGANFGLYPQIVAEVFAEVGVGSPVPEPQRTLIRAQFVALMEEMRRAFEQGQGQG